ncbi:MAG TPA: RNA-binding protein [Patescibacteria group bacterium]|nr:RNA-binding protein [Patescibacteria group bacterium]
MAKRLFIGGIPYRMTDEELQQLLSEAGAVESVTIVTDRMTGRSKGFAFADMANDEDAKKAIELLNGKDVDGRKIVVNEARPREERPSFDRGGAGGGGSRFGGDRRRGGPRHS